MINELEKPGAALGEHTAELNGHRMWERGHHNQRKTPFSGAQSVSTLGGMGVKWRQKEGVTRFRNNSPLGNRNGKCAALVVPWKASAWRVGFQARW